MTSAGPKVGIIMGSQSDWATMKHAADVLDELGVDEAEHITVVIGALADRAEELGLTAAQVEAG